MFIIRPSGTSVIWVVGHLGQHHCSAAALFEQFFRALVCRVDLDAGTRSLEKTKWRRYCCTTIFTFNVSVLALSMTKKSCPISYYTIYKQMDKSSQSFYISVCPRSRDPIYIVSYYINWVTTSWTDGRIKKVGYRF